MLTESTTRRAEVSRSARKAVMLGILLSLLLCVIKGLAGYFGNAYVLIADAIESLTDVVSSFMIWIALGIAATPPSERHPYGKGRAETLAAMLTALVLFAAAIAIAIQSINEISVAHRAPAPFTLFVLLAVIIIKEFLFRKVGAAGKELESVALRSDAWHHRSDALTSTAAFVGVSVALIGGQEYAAADDWAALFAAGIIALTGFSLLLPALRELFDASPNPALEQKVREIASSVPGVLGTHKCFVRKLGFDHFVDLDILVEGEISVKAGHDLAHNVQDKLRQELPFITRVLIHVEPHDEHGRRPLF